MLHCFLSPSHSLAAENAGGTGHNTHPRSAAGGSRLSTVGFAPRAPGAAGVRGAWEALAALEVGEAAV